MKPQSLVALVNYVFSYMPYTTDIENRLTLYFLAICIFTGKDHFTISLKSIGEGNFSLTGSRNTQKTLNGLGITSDEILIGAQEINDRGLFEIEQVYGYEDLIRVRLNLLENITFEPKR